MFTTEEINSLIFYQGDINNYKMERADADNKYKGDFYRTKYAYHILNMLLFPGIDNEETRICKEQKRLPICLLDDMDEILCVYKNIFSAMCKYIKSKKGANIIHAFRKDRMQSFDVLKQNYLPTFTSCALENVFDDYFLKKDGILILEYDILDSVPHIILNDVIQDSSFQYQQEILLPPFVLFEKMFLELTEEEKTYRDVKGEPPKQKLLLQTKRMLFDVSAKVGKTLESGKTDRIKCYESIVNNSKNAIRILEKMSKGQSLIQTEKDGYIKWKEDVRNLVYITLEEIYKQLLAG